MKVFRIILMFLGLILTMVPNARADQRGNGGNMNRIVTFAAPYHANQILGMITPERLTKDVFIPQALRNQGITPERIRVWYAAHREQLRHMTLSEPPPIDTHSFFDVVDEDNENDHAFTTRAPEEPIFFNPQAKNLESFEDAAWVWINELVHKVPDDVQTIDRSAWREDLSYLEDNFSAIVTGALKRSWHSLHEVKKTDLAVLEELADAVDRRDYAQFEAALIQHPNIHLSYSAPEFAPLLHRVLLFLTREHFDQVEENYFLMYEFALALLSHGASVHAKHGEKDVFDIMHSYVDNFFVQYPDRGRVLVEILLDRTRANLRPVAANKLLKRYVLASDPSDLDSRITELTTSQGRFEALLDCPYLSSCARVRRRQILSMPLSEDQRSKILYRGLGMPGDLGFLQDDIELGARDIIKDNLYKSPLYVLTGLVTSQQFSENHLGALAMLDEAFELTPAIHSQSGLHYPYDAVLHRGGGFHLSPLANLIVQGATNQVRMLERAEFTDPVPISDILAQHTLTNRLASQLIELGADVTLVENFDPFAERTGERRTDFGKETLLTLAVSGKHLLSVSDEDDALARRHRIGLINEDLISTLVAQPLDVNSTNGRGQSPLLIVDAYRRIVEHACPHARKLLDNYEAIVKILKEQNAEALGELAISKVVCDGLEVKLSFVPEGSDSCVISKNSTSKECEQLW